MVNTDLDIVIKSKYIYLGKINVCLQNTVLTVEKTGHVKSKQGIKTVIRV